ncbi:unnamed protein product [Effrenium voratum]|nr:unnamed protein product [Effrenium voratum]
MEEKEEEKKVEEKVEEKEPEKPEPEPAKEPAEPTKEVKAADKQAKPESTATLVALVLGALVLATALTVGSMAQEQGVQRWSESLFEKHVVPPPEVPSNVCTIQFCQS